MKTFALALALTLAAFGSCVAKNIDEFASVATGFHVTKPPTWQFLTAQQNSENMREVRLADADLQAQMVKYATAPLVLITKYPEPFADLNPSLKVIVRPLGPLKGQSAKAILEVMIPQLQRGFRHFSITTPPSNTVMSGLPAAHAQFSYVLEVSHGREFPAASEIWIVPRGDYFFVVGTSTRQDEATGSRSEIRTILNTVRIDR